MHRISFISAAMVLTLAGLPAQQRRQPRATPSDAEYAIFSLVVEELILSNESGRKPQQIVIQRTTSAGVPPGLNSITQMADAGGQQIRAETADTLMKSLIALNKESEVIDPLRVKSSLKCTAADADELDRFFRKNGGSWDAYYRQYPGAQGITYLSRVALDAAGRTGLLYVGTTSAGVAGIGRLVMVVRIGDTWKVRRSGIVWVS